MPRPPRPDDLYRLRIATEPRLSPDGSLAVITVQTVAAGYDAYRQALWLVPTDGSAAPRQLTLGTRHDHHARFAPDGRTLAFLSDRRPIVEEEPRRSSDAATRQDEQQVHVLPLDAPGEARRVTDLPRGVDAFEWSPDGTRLVVVSSSVGATHEEDARRRRTGRRPEPGAPPPSDLRFIDRLEYLSNGAGFTYDKVPHLWLVDLTTRESSRLTDGPASTTEPTWSPDGRWVAYSTNARPDRDLVLRQDIHAVEVATRRVVRLTRGRDSVFGVPAWMPDGRHVAALGYRDVRRGGTRNDIWLFAADGSDATPSGGRNLSARHDLMPGSGMVSDITPGETSRLWSDAGGRWVTFTAPIEGAYELWRISTDDGRVERRTRGRHYISSYDAVETGRGRTRIACLRSTATEPPDLWLQDGGGEPRRLTRLNDEALADIELHEPVERRVTVDGRDVRGWFIPGATPSRDAKGPGPLVTEIHGGPHALYGSAPNWEFQILAGAGIGVFYANPRGSEGYGEAFNDANHRDWGPGPARDVLAGVDALVEDGLADPERLGLTGGSYGGYLTTWIVAHDDRFRAAMTCRSVSDMASLFLTGDISGGDWARMEFDVAPWEDPDYFREISPLTYAAQIRTPLLIQHSERDLRTTIAQAEALFTVLRSHRRPVRLMRVPDETHELTRSGTPFRRVANLEAVLGWFRHYLVEGRPGLPPLPRIRGGR